MEKYKILEYPETKTFIHEFKLLMMEGIIIKKYCKKFGTVFRKYTIPLSGDKLEWTSKKYIKKEDNYILLQNITKFEKGVPNNFMATEEHKKKFIKVEYKKMDETNNFIHYNILLEFINEYARNMFYDGFELLLLEKKGKIEKYKKMKTFRTMIQRIKIEDEESSDDE